MSSTQYQITYIQFEEQVSLFRRDLIVCSQRQVMDLRAFAKVHALQTHNKDCINMLHKHLSSTVMFSLTVPERMSCGQQLSRCDLQTRSSVNLTRCLDSSPVRTQHMTDIEWDHTHTLACVSHTLRPLHTANFAAKGHTHLPVTAVKLWVLRYTERVFDSVRNKLFYTGKFM